MKKLNFILFLIFTICVMFIAFVISKETKEPKEITVDAQKSTQSKEEIIKKIEQQASLLYEEPHNPYIDRVWKKTPGRNGRQVNVKKSYEKMKKIKQYDESLLVYDTIEPKKSLRDLPPSPIFRGHPEKQMVSLLINVSWGTEYIPQILKTLDNHDVKATFFIEGKWAKENSELVKMIDDEGHIIGNHSYNHPDMATIANSEKQKQIDQTNHILHSITKKQPIWYAPPSGSYNDEVIRVAHNLSMETILWTVDTIDWKNPSVSVMINRVMTNIHPGATILMHPTKVVSEGLATMIEEIKDKNYKLGTIEDLLSTNRS